MRQEQVINKKQLTQLFEVQVNTNIAYMGENWFEVFPFESVRCSIYREFAEFLDETERDWHCYKPNPTFDKTAAVYEMVDVIHFGITAVLGGCLSMGLETEDALEENVNIHPSENFYPTMRSLEYYFTQFMTYNDALSLAKFITAACVYLDISIETYIKAHMRKNERNRIRAAAGVMQGNYDKSKELPLTLEF